MASNDHHFCTICNIPCNGPEPYKQHMASARHKKKVSLGSVMGSLPDPSLKDLRLTVEEQRMCGLLTGWSEPCAQPTNLFCTPANVLQQQMHHCQLCDCSASGSVPFQQHLFSKKHLSRVNSQRNDMAAAQLLPIHGKTPLVEITPCRPNVGPDAEDHALKTTHLKGVVVVMPGERIKDFLPQLGF